MRPKAGRKQALLPHPWVGDASAGGRSGQKMLLKRVVTARPDTVHDLGAIRSWAQIVPHPGTKCAQIKTRGRRAVDFGRSVVIALRQAQQIHR